MVPGGGRHAVAAAASVDPGRRGRGRSELESLPDGGGAVWVHGLMTFCWDGGDEAGRRLAAELTQRIRELAAAEKS